MIIQYDPEWIATTPCPNGRRFVSRTEAQRAAFCPSQAGPQNIWVGAKRGAVAVLSRLARAIARKGRRKAVFVSRCGGLFLFGQSTP
ncbi:hypothetical protein P4S95_25430, partial [Aneurinibacillus aneurinilyticus]|uniref:hypothetical protein n=1 Tax=Aneurinibacillus aneurinilyticus TaxID=1391 RepID=UPI002E1A9E96|nr:hypothetical protein [Aneurinibacillus aneurinilyticus]